LRREDAPRRGQHALRAGFKGVEATPEELRREDAPGREGSIMGILKGIGVALIVLWLVLWLFVKITFAAIHLLLLIGLAMLVFGLIRRETSGP
jgi:Flp pilus assembly protein TadB